MLAGAHGALHDNGWERREDSGYSSCTASVSLMNPQCSQLSTSTSASLSSCFSILSAFLLPCQLISSLLVLTPHPSSLSPSIALFLYHCLAHLASARKQFGADYSPATPTRPYTQTFTLVLTHAHTHSRKHTLRLCVSLPPTMPLHHPLPAALKHELV